eukprot:111857-Pyramimonas_sp.AAC.1
MPPRTTILAIHRLIAIVHTIPLAHSPFHRASGQMGMRLPHERSRLSARSCRLLRGESDRAHR